MCLSVSKLCDFCGARSGKRDRPEVREFAYHLEPAPPVCPRGRLTLDLASSLASRLGLAKHAHAFRLWRAIFTARDVQNVGKRLLARSIGMPGPAGFGAR